MLLAGLRRAARKPRAHNNSCYRILIPWSPVALSIEGAGEGRRQHSLLCANWDRELRHFRCRVTSHGGSDIWRASAILPMPDPGALSEESAFGMEGWCEVVWTTRLCT